MVHPTAAHGYAAQSAAYARGRPGYPGQLIDWLRDELGLGPGSTALELGAGTGKFTVELLRTGARVVAVEPVAQMRTELQAAAPAADIRDGSAEAIPCEDQSIDAVLCAQSFHWFASAQTLAEISRLLRAGGRLGLVWNMMDERVDWVAALMKLVAPYEGDAPRRRSGAWRELFPAPGFGPLVEARFDYRHEGPAEQVIVDRIASTSFIAARDPMERSSVMEKVRKLVAETPALSGGGSVAFPYQTVTYSCRKQA